MIYKDVFKERILLKNREFLKTLPDIKNNYKNFKNRVGKKTNNGINMKNFATMIARISTFSKILSH